MINTTKPIKSVTYNGTSVPLDEPALTGDAIEANVLSGKTFYSNSTTKKTGTMPTYDGSIALPYLTFSSPSEFTITTSNSTKNWDGTLEYSTDTTTWTTWAGTSAISSSGGKLYLRGTNNTVIAGINSNNYRWILTGSNISCSGNIENLLDYATVANGQHPTMGWGCYAYMFFGCTALITAPKLPATTLANACYFALFWGCTSLTMPPKLPATTLADSCYQSMFYGCTSLTALTELPVTELPNSCYVGMFAYCSNIKLSTTRTGIYQTPYRIPTSGTGISSGLPAMFDNTGGTFTGTPSINTTYYTSNNIVLSSPPQEVIQEIFTASAMNALLIARNVGKTYRFVGTTDDDYTNGDLYKVESV